MMRCLKKNTGYYCFLFFIFAFGILLVSLTSYNRQLQILITVMTAFSYVLFGIVHHLLHHDLTPKIVVEYALIGALGVSFVLFLLKAGF